MFNKHLDRGVSLSGSERTLSLALFLQHQRSDHRLGPVQLQRNQSPEVEQNQLVFKKWVGIHIHKRVIKNYHL